MPALLRDALVHLLLPHSMRYAWQVGMLDMIFLTCLCDQCLQSTTASTAVHMWGANLCGVCTNINHVHFP